MKMACSVGWRGLGVQSWTAHNTNTAETFSRGAVKIGETAKTRQYPVAFLIDFADRSD